MGTPYLSEIRLMSFTFAPKNWAMCNGQLLPINQNQALFFVLGTTYGGDGRVNFALPDLRGRSPMHMGAGHTLGERGGEQSHTLSIQELPTHLHTASGTTDNTAATAVPTNAIPTTTLNAYGDANGTITQPVALRSGTVANQGGSQAHLNMQPYLTLTYCIALAGIFPSQA